MRINGKGYVAYSVWNNKTDDIVIVDGTAEETAKAMGVTMKSFYTIVSRSKKGILEKYIIGTRLFSKGE